MTRWHRVFLCGLLAFAGQSSGPTHPLRSGARTVGLGTVFSPSEIKVAVGGEGWVVLERPTLARHRHGSPNLASHLPLSREDRHATEAANPTRPGKESMAGPAIAYSVLVGAGYQTDDVTAVAVDPTGALYVAGSTTSPAFPTTNAFQANHRGMRDAYVLKLSPDGSRVEWATYLGGQQDDAISGIQLEPDGSIVVTGVTNSPDFPLADPIQAKLSGGRDGFVARFNPTSSQLLFSTFLGGAEDDEPKALALRPAGEIVVAGITSSRNFPVTSNAFQKALSGSSDLFVTVLDKQGQAISFSSYLGGSRREEMAWGGMDIGLGGTIYLAGTTFSTDFPLKAPVQAQFGGPLEPIGTGRDAFLSRIDPTTAELVFSTYLGGAQGETANGVRVDESGIAFMTGCTSSNDFPATMGSFRSYDPQGVNLFVVKVDPRAMRLSYSVLVGAPGASCGSAIALDRSGRAYVWGNTVASEFPLKDPLQTSPGQRSCPTGVGWQLAPCRDAVLLRLNAEGTNLELSTYLGGYSNNYPTALVVDTHGATYVVGLTGDASFPVTFPTGLRNGGVFVTKLRPAGPGGRIAAILNSASWGEGRISPGALLTVFGTGLTSVEGVLAADGFPLPHELGGTKVLVNGVEAPLLAVANRDGLEQVNFQAPRDVYGRGTVVVLNGKRVVYQVGLRVMAATPGIFVLSQGVGAVFHGRTFELVTAERPAERGQLLTLYATGLGDTEPPVPAGEAAPDPAPLTKVTPEVWLAGRRARVHFSGLVPGFAGLYRIDFELPATTPTGGGDLRLQYDFASSNVVRVPVR